MKENKKQIPKQITNRSEAEQCVRVVGREMADGSKAIQVQLVAPFHCHVCNHEELVWKDLHSFALKDDKKETYKEAVGKARKMRLNTIDMLMQSTTAKEWEIKG